MHDRIVMFVQDISHSHTLKRAESFKQNKIKVDVYGFIRRKSNLKLTDDYQSLGFYPEKQYICRLAIIIKSAIIIRKKKCFIDSQSILYAYNFDLLIMIFISKLLNRSINQTVLYEVADIQKISIKKSVKGVLIRVIERYIIDNFVDKLIITSLGYYDGYFNQLGIKFNKIFLWENKVFPIPIEKENKKPYINNLPNKWNITYAGNIRCLKSLIILENLVRENIIILNIHGKPNFNYFSEYFWDQLISLDGVNYHGSYIYPDGLKLIYRDSHFCWSAELLDDKERNKWPEANRVYEGGLYKIPQIALNKDNYTAMKLSQNGWGLVFNKPYNEQIIKGLRALSLSDYNTIIANYNRCDLSMFSGCSEAEIIINMVK